ncbi:DUF4402 domain-containing protein [Massilia sp. TS11]|uniref:DUF4402 domain-containing protein n=1 Tax=Massilia sp. TS11 TaxID=2908003 RepID=UPI001EDB3806|nr:DUF4402 domain-containing protein [Massilia sp. TS11]MCG2586471.1 DUF4402 domain-containing protein [Massilia sp. TS11]
MHTKTFIRAIALAALAAGFSHSASAASATASGTATVIAPMTITKTNDLRFGAFAPTTSAGTVTIATGGARTGSNVSLSSLNAGGAASFNVTGDTTATYAITLPTTATLSGPGTAMTISSFTSNPSGTGTLSAGAGTISVGGTLAVGASQTAGSYSGSFSVTVDYN